MSEHPSLKLVKQQSPLQLEIGRIEETVQTLRERQELIKQLPNAIIQLNTEALTGQLKEIAEGYNETTRLVTHELESARGEFAMVLAGLEAVLAEVKRKNDNLMLEREVLLKLKAKLA